MDTKKHHINTLLAHLGRKDKSHHGAVNPPVVRASTMLFPTVAALRESDGKRHAYGRYGTETTQALEDVLCATEGADRCFITPSGLSAITTTLLALLKTGDHLLMVDSCYGPARNFCEGMLKNLGITTTYYDPLIGAEIKQYLQANTKVVFVESPGSLSFEMQDVPAISQVAHDHGALVVSDSTWATPIGWKPFELGVDVSIHAATKYIVGHSDVLMGAILCLDSHIKKIEYAHKQLGISVSSDDASLALRGMRTLTARLAQHKINAFAVANWLETQQEVAKVLYPPLPSSDGHAIWKRDFNPDFACGLMSVVFKEDITAEQVEALIDRTRLFGIGYSWGGYESLILPIALSKIKTINAHLWQSSMMRLHIGLEAHQDLIEDLNNGFLALRKST
jgi:cystathionine beta-lyase